MNRYQILLFIVSAMLGVSSYAGSLPSPVTDADYYNNGKPNPDKVELGRLLFFDKILSGNKNIACSTCHHPAFWGGDGLSVSVGEGGVGLGTERTTGTGTGTKPAFERIGRNSPPLFNIGAMEFTRMNWQGRHELRDTGLSLPCRSKTVNSCPPGIENVIAGQNLFPLVNVPEMPGHPRENEVTDAFPKGVKGAERFPFMWEAIMVRLRAIPDYVNRFKTVYGVSSASQMTISQLVNALAAFEATAFRSDQSPFDEFLRGNATALTNAQVRGMNLFYGSANCSSCHSGKFQTDQNFHAIAMPQLGAGVFVSGRSEGQRDVGRYEVTGVLADRGKFRTPSLRNVALTSPYGHDGAYLTLEDTIRHHLDPVSAFNAWDRSQVILAELPSGVLFDDFAVMDDAVKAKEITDANELAASRLSASQINDIIEFLNALTDPNAIDMTEIVPASVPSGLPVKD